MTRRRVLSARKRLRRAQDALQRLQGELLGIAELMGADTACGNTLRSTSSRLGTAAGSVADVRSTVDYLPTCRRERPAVQR